jgi:uncharacterized protein (DUF305 family)
VRCYTFLDGEGILVTHSHTAVLALGAAIALGACGGDSDNAQPSAKSKPKSGTAEPNVIQPGAPGEPSRKLEPDELAQVEPPEHAEADVDFMRGMIHHHAQALVMTSLVRERGASRDIPLLARRMELSQQSEMELMEQWMKRRGEKPPDAEDHLHDHGAGGGLMPGMFSSDKLAVLAEAEGREFDRLFLGYMIRHHRGALTMVSRLNAANGGQEPEVGAFSRHIEADQHIEIGRMQELQVALGREPNRPIPRRARPLPTAAEREALSAGGKPLICIIPRRSAG